MNRWLTRMVMAATFAFGALIIDGTAIAEDEKKPEMKKDEKKKDDAKEPTEKPKKAPEMKPSDWTKYPKHSDATGELVKITESSITLRNQVPMRRGNQMTMQNIDVEYTWHENGLARNEKPPKFFDDKGLERKGKPEELYALRKPTGVPGYWMNRDELKTGDLIRVELVRPSTIQASKVKVPDDLLIKYAHKVGEHPKPTKPLDGEPKKK
jgi:hypothetical protein